MVGKAVQYPLRMEKSLRDEIKFVSEHSHVSMNRLIVEAIREYLPERRKRIQQELTETLRLLDQYSEHDSDFEEAIEEFAAAEVSCEDPLEGKLFDVRNQSESTGTEAGNIEELEDLSSRA